MSRSGWSMWRDGHLSAARALVLLAAMAGLFAMHGLSDHGAMHDDEMTLGVFANMPAGRQMAGLAHGDETSQRPVLDDASSTSLGVHGAAPHDVMDGAMGLCLTVLAGILLLLTPRALPGTNVRSARGEVWLRRLVTTARDPDPPDLVNLCIHRC